VSKMLHALIPFLAKLLKPRKRLESLGHFIAVPSGLRNSQTSSNMSLARSRISVHGKSTGWHKKKSQFGTCFIFA
jgi:hypothetical protein